MYCGDDRWDIDSLRELESPRAATRRLGGLTLLPTALTSLANAFILQGDLERAASANAEAAQIDTATGNRLSFSVGAILAARGDDDAAALIDAQIDFARAAGLGLSTMTALASAMLHNSLGEYDQALAAAREAAGHRWEWVGHLSLHELVEATVRCGETGVAADALARLSATVDPHGSEWALRGPVPLTGSPRGRRERRDVLRGGDRAVGPHLGPSGPGARTCCTGSGSVGSTAASTPAPRCAPPTRCSTRSG